MHNTNTVLPIRPTQGLTLVRPARLTVVADDPVCRLPALSCQLEQPAPQQRTMLLQIHNRAGIPIIAARAVVAVGQAVVVFRDLQPLGIEAYNHAPEAERLQVARRIWSRSAYGTVSYE